MSDLQGRDFWSLFASEIEKKKWGTRQKGGVVVYFDIFRFQEVVDFLRRLYELKPADEDIRFGNKFSFALYFDRELRLLADMTFFTESAYIRKHKKVPCEKAFREFEEKFKHQLLQDFNETAKDPEKFNAAMQKVLLRYGVDLENCRMQIPPVLTLNSNILRMLGRHFGVTEKYLSASASVQSLADAASRYGFYRKLDQSEDSWVGIPLWVHRRCRYPMFTISNVISYGGRMVQGIEENGKTGWFDVGGTAHDKYVEEQGEFLLRMLRQMAAVNPKILDKKEKDVVFVITPFSNVAYQLSRKLKNFFTRYDAHGKPTNIGTVHTFQGKEAPIVFFVLGADSQSAGAARWAVDAANIMNVAATRAKEEFYVIGDRKLYLGLGCDVVTDMDRILRQYKEQHPELVASLEKE